MKGIRKEKFIKSFGYLWMAANPTADNIVGVVGEDGEKLWDYITKSNREAVEGFVEFLIKERKKDGGVITGVSLAEDGVPPTMTVSSLELGSIVARYLSQLNKEVRE